MPGTRLQSDVSSGQKSKKGSQLNQVGHDVGPQLPVVPDNRQFQQTSFDAVRGNSKGGSQHAGAPDDGGGGPSMPGGQPLQGHHFSANASGGNSPRRSPGKSTPTDEGTRRKLSTAGS